MSSTDASGQRLALNLVLLSCVLAAVLAACGGGDAGVDGSVVDVKTDTAVASAGPTVRASAKAAARAVKPLQPLLDDDGNLAPSIPGAVPTDHAARTRAGHYATEAQAQALELALGPRVVRTEVEPQADPSDAVGLAVYLTYTWLAVHNLPLSALVLVRGADARLVATFANRLADDGFTRVVTVTG